MYFSTETENVKVENTINRNALINHDNFPKISYNLDLMYDIFYIDSSKVLGFNLYTIIQIVKGRIAHAKSTYRLFAFKQYLH